MTAIVLRQLSGMAVTTPKPPLEVMFKCANGILLRVPAHTVFRHLRRDPNAQEADDPRKVRKLVRELIAFKRAKQK